MPESQGGNFFTRKLGPLPIWAWAAIVIGALGAYAYWRKIGPFAASSGNAAAGSGVDSGSLASMLGAGGSPNLGVLADGGPVGGVISNTTGSSSTGSGNGPAWFGPAGNFPEHVREYLKLHPGSPAPTYGGLLPGAAAGVR